MKVAENREREPLCARAREQDLNVCLRVLTDSKTSPELGTFIVDVAAVMPIVVVVVVVTADSRGWTARHRRPPAGRRATVARHRGAAK